MLTRRELIGSACATSALSSLPLAVGFAASKVIPAACIVDRSLVGSDAQILWIGFEGLSVFSYFEDPGGVWMHRLEPMLRDRPVAIAGYTTAPGLFCLQYLARDYGLMLAACCDGVSQSVAFTGEPSAATELIDTHQHNHGSPMTWLLAPQRG